MKRNTRTILPPPPEDALWYDRDLPLKLGCTACPELEVCGGLRVAAGIFDCRSLCSCARQGKRCFGVCRRDPAVFVSRVREVGGFDFGSVPRCAPVAARAIPEYVPIIYDGTKRHGRLNAGTVAIPLMSMFNRASGTGRFETREEMLEHFRLSGDTRVILSGVAKDAAIERWWSFADRPRLIETLHALGVDMVTTPNYSLFTDVTRLDNLHNMKRIALTFAEFTARGMSCALHVNARTDTDYRRFADFIGERDEVSAVAFEFLTGTATVARGADHCNQLAALPARVGRPLRLVVRGGRRHLRQLSAAFASITVLDADPFMKAKHRQRARLAIGADVDWHSSRTAKHEPLDQLLQHNVELARQATSLRLGWLRADYAHAEARQLRPLLEPGTA